MSSLWFSPVLLEVRRVFKLKLQATTVLWPWGGRYDPTLSTGKLRRFGELGVRKGSWEMTRGFGTNEISKGRPGPPGGTHSFLRAQVRGRRVSKADDRRRSHQGTEAQGVSRPRRRQLPSAGGCEGDSDRDQSPLGLSFTSRKGSAQRTRLVTVRVCPYWVTWGW